MRKPDIQPDRLRMELSARLGAITDLETVAEGEESRAFAFRRGAEAFIVRVNRAPDGFLKDSFAHRHFAGPALPIPEILFIARFGDHTCCVSRRVPGTTLQDLDEKQLCAALAAVEKVMIAMAAADVTMCRGYGPIDADGAGQFESWVEFLTAITDSAIYEWQTVVEGDRQRQIDRFLQQIAEMAGHCGNPRNLVHGDFGSNNVLAENGAVTGVVDWSEALLGDPLYDLANILFWRPWLVCMEKQAAYFETHRPGLLAANAGKLRCYQLRIGLEETYDAARHGDGRMLEWSLARCARIAQSAAS